MKLTRRAWMSSAAAVAALAPAQEPATTAVPDLAALQAVQVPADVEPATHFDAAFQGSLEE